MKKVIFWMLGIVAMFASCSQSEELLTEGNNAKEVTFSLTADSQVQTRATGSLRYLMAIYDESGENEVVATTEFGSSTFAVRLEPGKYTCLFWADHGSGNYNASDLKKVVLQDGATEVEAFSAKQGITVTDGGTVNVTLSRAVAKVVLKETDRLEAGSITVSYDGFKGFDVSQQAGILPATLTQTLPIASVLTGSATAPTEVGSFLLLANPDERVLSDFRVQYNSEAEKTITNVPVQANYVTNINGKFSVNVAQQFSITIDDNWATPEKEVDFPPYLTFSAADEQMFKMEFDDFSLGTGEYFEYAVGNGEWTRFTATVSNIAFGGTHGDLRLRGKSSQGTASGTGGCRISFPNAATPVGCTGDIRTLIDYTDYAHVSTANARFSILFAFCTSLTHAPALPATTLASECYNGMFVNCTSLTQAPALPATTLAERCYANMFEGCTSLTQAPALPATTLAEGCYQSMFWKCRSLTQAPELPATTLADYCYYGMFWHCISLTQAPELPATTLADYCYASMFEDCRSLSSVTMLATDVSATGCFDAWLVNAGTSATSRTLTLANQDIYNTLSSNAFYLPDIWKQGQATIQYTNP